MIRAKDGRVRLRAMPAALLGIACLAFPASAAAAPPVINTNDSGSGSLRFAIDNATSGDTIPVPPGTYNISSELLVDLPMTIDGAGAGATVINAGGNSRVFRVQLPPGGTVPTATIQDVTVRGGAAPSSTTEGGGGIFNVGSGTLTVDQSVITGNAASSPGGSGSVHGGGGISNESAGGLNISNSTISGNSLSYGPGGSSNGGGGVHSATGDLVILNSTISGNTVTSSGSVSLVGGGGVYGAGNTLQIGNSTISGNTASVPSGASNGGGGILVNVSQSSDLLRITLAGNTTTGTGGGLLRVGAVAPGIGGSLVSGNSPTGCAGGISTVGNNAENGNSCGFSNTVNDLVNTDPQLGPLEDNGGPTATHAIPPASPVIDVAFCGQSALVDQRGVTRPKGNNCEPGAYEFDGLSSVPAGCSRTGNFPVTLFPPAGSSATAARFRIDGGAEGSAPASGNAATVQVPAGNHTLEFWGDFSPPTGGQELEHHLRSVLVDPTGPLLRITSDQSRNGYTVGETASFSVRASDALSGLTSDPSVSRRAINTSSPRRITIRRSATDGCGNATTRQLLVTVLAKPVLGKRVNLIPLSGRVLIRLPGRGARAGARASQKGRPFIPLRQARQVPVGSLIDTRKGRVRLVSARDARARRVQAGQFYSGIFQVLQARKRRLKGLTTLSLKGSSFNPCKPRPRGKRATAALSKRAIRRLRARANGRFRTRGRYSAATVRGTVWTTTDRCDGTLTRVSRGRVAVRDFRRRKTIIVRRGKSYLAKAPVR